MLARFIQDTRGATAVEYGLIAAVLSLVIVSGVSMVMTALQTEYTDINSDLNQALR
ncbi:MAG: Flp family type IVb pilin [Pseudomonadota bacterium]